MVHQELNALTLPSAIVALCLRPAGAQSADPSRVAFDYPHPDHQNPHRAIRIETSRLLLEREGWTWRLQVWDIDTSLGHTVAGRPLHVVQLVADYRGDRFHELPSAFRRALSLWVFAVAPAVTP